MSKPLPKPRYQSAGEYLHRLPGGAVDSLDFEITINPTAALGYDPISGSVNYTNTRSLIAGDTSVTAIDSLYIQSFNPALITLNSVSITPFYVNRNQTGIVARVRVSNGGQAGVRVDNLTLSFVRPTISSAATLLLSASFLTSAATTAKPLPCSPALAQLRNYWNAAASILNFTI